MKKLTLTLIAISPLLTNSLFSNTIITRTKTQCIPGCNTVTKEYDKTPYKYDEFGNVIEYTTHIIINCSGFGLSSCPNQMAAPGEEIEIDPFTNTNGQLLFDYALNQISLGTLNGRYFTNFLNTTTGQLWKFTATWTTVGGVETIVITKDPIP